MKRAVLLSVVLSLAISVGAEPFGAAFPVTNTRYRGALGEPRLVANDSEFFLFWGAENKIRAARVDDGEARVSHVVLDTALAFDVAWTGDRYLIVSSRQEIDPPAQLSYTVVGRVLDAEARPVGPEFPIAEGTNPRVAVGEHSIAVLYTVGLEETRLVLLSRNGRTIETPSRVIGPFGTAHDITQNGDGFLALVGTTGAGMRAIALDQHGQTVAENTFVSPVNVFHHVAVASDGTKALALWSENHRAVAVTIGQTAAFGAPRQFLAITNTPAVVWNGTGWTISYAENNSPATAKVVITQLDANGQAILSREESAAGNFSPTIAALDGEILAAWRPGGQNKSPVLSELPLAGQHRRETPYTPARQTLLATASSEGGTLTVWSEAIEGGFSIHAGIRNLQGQWSERQLTTSSSPVTTAAAQSDGEGFVVGIAGSSSSLIRIDSDGHVLAPLALPFAPAVIGWNGSNYAVFDAAGRGVLVSPSGVVSGTVTPELGFTPSVVASNGDGFLVAGVEVECQFLLCAPSAIMGVRLGPDLQRVDTEDLRIPASGFLSLAGAAWDGSSYVLVGNDDGIGFLAYLPVSFISGAQARPLNLSFAPEAMTVLRDGTIAVAGRLNDTTYRVSVINREGLVLQTSDIEENVTGLPRLEQLADGGIAFIASSIQDAAPHDGTSRIVTAIGRSSIVPPPAAPHVSATEQNGVMRIFWSGPAGTVNGYRLEYRVDDDEWVEWEEWFGPGVHSKSIRRPDFGTKFAFRVRAFNDGGAGEYSAPALTTPSRRRAVRQR